MKETHEHTDACGSGCSHEKPAGPDPIDLGFPKPKSNKPMSPSTANKYVKRAIGVSVAQVRKYLQDYVFSNAEELCEDIVSIAPYNSYAKLLEEKSAIISFFKGEMNKSKNWKLSSIDSKVQEDTPLVVFSFKNISADDGSIVKGFVFVDRDGQELWTMADGKSTIFSEESSAPNVLTNKKDKEKKEKNAKKK